jgi:hypothetical protein
VNVEYQPARRAQGCYDLRADGEIGDEVAVHDVDVDVVGAGCGHRLDLGAQASEIGREDRRGYADLLLHGDSMDGAKMR